MEEADDMEIILAFIGGSALAALINQVGEYIRTRRKRKDEKTDTESTSIKAVKTALRYILYDRIRHLGQAYIKEGLVDFDDRRILNDMHHSYHNDLGGNGDLDTLMRQVNALPLQ